MSKIFDALRKVQAEVGAKQPDPAAPEAEEGTDGGRPVDPGVPEAFIAEIVSMRYSLESKIGRAHKALAFACAVKGEGVSTVSRMFCRTLVQDPASKVVLVDANVHSPSVHKTFDVSIGPGLADLLMGRSTLQECLRDTDHPRLKVIAAGESMVPPMQAFAASSMKKFIADALAVYDYLVFDTPPVLHYPETTVLSSQVDGVVFVVQAMRTKKEVVMKAVEALRKGGGEVLGLVLNKNKHFIPEFIYKRV
jgi:capsular exopolysaccharide synthesis family protein